MLLLKRLLTAGGCFFPSAVILSVIVIFIGGAIVGGMAGAQAGDPALAAEAGQAAGQKFGEQYGAMLILGSCAFAGLISLAIAFSGILPWCRRPKEPAQPPSLPGED